MTEVRIKKPDQVSWGERGANLRGIEVNKIVPVREIEAAAPRSLLPRKQKAHTHTQLSAYQCPGDNRVTILP